jgi:hypothetical protein
MSSFEAELSIVGRSEPAMGVEIDLDEEKMRIKAGEVEVAEWRLDDIRVSALVDGFHVRAEGEEVLLDVVEDGRFAVELGLRSAHPHLRQRMSAILRPQD